MFPHKSSSVLMCGGVSERSTEPNRKQKHGSVRRFNDSTQLQGSAVGSLMSEPEEMTSVI